MRLIDKARRVPWHQWCYYLPLITAAAGLLFFLEGAPLPWEEGVAAREAAGQSVKSVHHMISGLWYGALAALAVIGLLAAAGPLVLRPLAKDFRRDAAGLGRRSTPVFLAFAGAAVAIAAIQATPRLGSSLWGDEDYTVRRAIVGQWERDADGELWFRETTWPDTLFYYRNPNNHVLFSIFARLAHSGYDPGGDPAKLHFDETRLRMPAFLFGLGAIVSLGYLLSVIGYRRAALAAMFILALHPWFLRHAPEARGYPLVLCLAPLALAFLIKAVRRGRGVYWLGFALAEAMAFYAYPGVVYLLLGFNIAALGYLFLARRDTVIRDRITLLARWFAANTLAALPMVFLMMPNLPQMRAYLARDRAQGNLDPAWLLDNLAHLSTGIPWSQPEPENPLRLALSTSPLLSVLLIAGFFGLGGLGVYRLLRAGRAWVAAALILPYLLMLLHALIGGVMLYQWYSVTSLPLVIAAVALGLEYWPSKIDAVRPRTLTGLAALALFLLVFGAATRQQVKILREHSVEPLRESVELTRQTLNPTLPGSADALTVGFCMGTPGYDPAGYFLKPESKDPQGPQRLRALMARADSEGLPLHVNFGLPGLARQQWPGLMEIVDDPRLFEPLPPLYGLQDPCTRFVYRYRGSAGRSSGATPSDGS